jgi:hypothetical protein
VWELNLAVTWLKTRRNRSASDGRIDRSAVIRSLDMEELQQDVDAWRRELTDEARRAASRLRLPEDRRIALVEQIIAGLE